MQLSTIKISNILSFPFVENLTTIEGVKFHNHKTGVVNIMIGPNGSGKSNLLDIIYAVRKYGITTNYEFTNKNNIPLITLANRTYHSLKKHRGQEEKKSHVYMSLLLNQDDYNNLFFLLKNREIINTIILEYGKKILQFGISTKEELLQYSKIPLYLSLDDDNNLILEKNTNPVLQFIYSYFQNFELIQLCIDIYNENNSKENRYPLRNTFALITSENNYTNKNIPKSIHLFCKKFQSLTQENKNTNKSLLEEFFLEATNKTLQKYIGLQLYGKSNISELNFLLQNKEGYTLGYEELSSGEQSFLSLILLIYSHDLHNGFIIIDEPELHLHPQSQKNFLALVEEMQNKQHMQCIITTHSPTMINEHNINHVFRCSKNNGETVISSTNSHFGEDESNLLQILKFDHIAKIFFVDTIILVEGETDMYFFSHYIEYLKTLPERSSRIHNYEIITISGKGGVRRRRQFLKKFNNRVYYIGDRDNTIEYNLLSIQELSSLPRHRLTTNKGSKYAAVVQYIQKNKNELYTRIVQGIQKLYNNNIFLLTQGDLEAYIGIQNKGLDDTIHFCVHDFSIRIQDPIFEEKRKEFLMIYNHIFPL